MEANAALRTLVRRDSGESYREMLTRLAQESGIETPTTADLIRLDRARKDKSRSNRDWRSPTAPEAKIAKLKDARTHLAYKPEHAVDLATGAIVAAELHPADQGDTATLPTTLRAAAKALAAVGAAPTPNHPVELVADKGYHSRDGLKVMADSDWKTRIAEQKTNGLRRWHGDDQARRAVYNNRIRNRIRLLSGVAHQAFTHQAFTHQAFTHQAFTHQAFKLRAERVERGFALVLDRGGMRRTWLRGRDNVHKRYLIHVAGYNLGLIMCLLVGAGTPKRWADHQVTVFLAAFEANQPALVILIAVTNRQTAALAGFIGTEPSA